MSDTGVEVTAGLGGFLVLFGLALVVWFLGWDLTRRLRRMRRREQERLAQEAADRDGPPRAAGRPEPDDPRPGA